MMYVCSERGLEVDRSLRLPFVPSSTIVGGGRTNRWQGCHILSATVDNVCIQDMQVGGLIFVVPNRGVVASVSLLNVVLPSAQPLQLFDCLPDIISCNFFILHVRVPLSSIKDPQARPSNGPGVFPSTSMLEARGSSLPCAAPG